MAGLERVHQNRKAYTGSDVGAAAKNAVLLFDRDEKVRKLTDVFRRSQKQISIRPQRVVKCRYHLILHVSAKIDQEIAARDQIDPGERWIADNAVGRENAEFTHILGHYIAAAVRNKEPLAAFRRNAIEQSFR